MARRCFLPAERHLWPADPADDWYPCHPRHTLEVRLCVRADDDPGPWRVACWGNDDFGLERDFADEATARAFLQSLPNPVSQAWLRGHGFGPA